MNIYSDFNLVMRIFMTAIGHVNTDYVNIHVWKMSVYVVLLYVYLVSKLHDDHMV